jgi:uncharacterized protein with HEPN domain
MVKDPKLFVVHILDEIKFLESIPQRMSFEEFLADPILSRAVAYSLQIISEASRKIPPEWLEDHLNIEWHKIRALGNRTRHEYADLQMPSLWAIITNDLEALNIVMKILMDKQDQPPRP